MSEETTLESVLANFDGNQEQLKAFVEAVKQEILSELYEREAALAKEATLIKHQAHSFIEEVREDPHVLAELYDSMRLVLRPWTEEKLASGLGVSGYTRKNVFGDTVAVLQNSYPKWKVELPLEDPDHVKEFKGTLDPVFSSFHAERKVKAAVDNFLRERGYLLITEDEEE